MNTPVVAGLIAVTLLGACGGSDSKKPASAAATATTTTTTVAAPATSTIKASGVAVTVRQFQFMPAELVVKTGTKVTWTNQDDILHTATSGATPGTADGTFDGPMDGPGKSFSFTFNQPGTFPYFCSRHNSMTAKVVVQ